MVLLPNEALVSGSGNRDCNEREALKGKGVIPAETGCAFRTLPRRCHPEGAAAPTLRPHGIQAATEGSMIDIRATGCLSLGRGPQILRAPLRSGVQAKDRCSGAAQDDISLGMHSERPEDSIRGRTANLQFSPWLPSTPMLRVHSSKLSSPRFLPAPRGSTP